MLVSTSYMKIRSTIFLNLTIVQSFNIMKQAITKCSLVDNNDNFTNDLSLISFNTNNPVQLYIGIVEKQVNNVILSASDMKDHNIFLHTF